MHQADAKSETNQKKPKVETHAEAASEIAEAAPDLAEAETEMAATVETTPGAEAPLESTTAPEK